MPESWSYGPVADGVAKASCVEQEETSVASTPAGALVGKKRLSCCILATGVVLLVGSCGIFLRPTSAGMASTPLKQRLRSGMTKEAEDQGSFMSLGQVTSGVCPLDVNCSLACCTSPGYNCVKLSQWWWRCEQGPGSGGSATAGAAAVVATTAPAAPAAPAAIQAPPAALQAPVNMGAPAADAASAAMPTPSPQIGGPGSVCPANVNCAKQSCCTALGYACVQKNAWWSSCDRSAAAAEDVAQPPVAATPQVPAQPVSPALPVAAPSAVPLASQQQRPQQQPQSQPPAFVPPQCAGPGEECTASKCCKDSTFQCQQRTDGMWWRFICRTSEKSPAGVDPAEASQPLPATVPAAAAPVPVTPSPMQEAPEATVVPTNIAPITIDECMKPLPEDLNQRWSLAERCSREMIRGMPSDKKRALLHGHDGGMGFAGYIPVEGVPGVKDTVRLTMNDGPQGYNGYVDKTLGKGTQYPDLIAVAASFNTALAARFGAAVAEEFKTKGCSVLLGPDVEVVRNPFSGRSFESLSGEDPYLGAQLGAAYVKEVQAKGIIATVKHWLDNNQEANRQTIDVSVSDRAQHEVYMGPFKGAIDAGAGGVMCSYNKVYGKYACENSKLLRTLLRTGLGFKGFVVSDWGAVHTGAPSAMAGLNIEMPTGKFYKNLDGVPEQTIDELAGQVLAAMYATGHFHGNAPQVSWSWPPPFYTDATNDAHLLVARETIIDSAVLLKNVAGALPMQTAGQKIVLVGLPCKQGVTSKSSSMFSASGSGYVATTKIVTPMAGLQDLVHDAASISWSENAAGAAGADVVIVCASAHAEEGSDRETLALPEAQTITSELSQTRSQKLILIAFVPGPVTTEWVDNVDAALVLFMPGEQVGPALAQLLTGQASPGGRLPISFPATGEHRFTAAQYPGVGMTSSFSEGVLVGYRWNDAKGVPSAFPFGFGLGYTEMVFSNFAANCLQNQDGAQVSLRVVNQGSHEGLAVPQLYISFPSLAPVVRQLRGFKKVKLAAGGSAAVQFRLNQEDWSFYDEARQTWVSAVDQGEEVTVSIGDSSADMKWTSSLHCAGFAPLEERDLLLAK